MVKGATHLISHKLVKAKIDDHSSFPLLVGSPLIIPPRYFQRLPPFESLFLFRGQGPRSVPIPQSRITLFAFSSFRCSLDQLELLEAGLVSKQSNKSMRR